MTTPRKLAAVGILAFSLSACSVTTDVDQYGLDYDYDSWSGKKTLDQCVAPGNRAWQDLNDPGVVYPAGQRSFEFAAAPDNPLAPAPGAEAIPITVVSKDNLEMSVTGVATFYLNGDCKVLQAFNDKIGQKYWASSDEGWLNMLGVYIKQPLDRAMDAAAKKYDWKQLYADPAVKQAWETEVATLAQQFIGEQSGTKPGQEFFINFRFTLQQPQPPQGVRDALAAAQQAIEENATQKNKNERIKTEIESIKELVEVLGPNGYVLYQAIKDGKVTIVPVPAGSAVNVSPQGGN